LLPYAHLLLLILRDDRPIQCRKEVVSFGASDNGALSRSRQWTVDQENRHENKVAAPSDNERIIEKGVKVCS